MNNFIKEINQQPDALIRTLDYFVKGDGAVNSEKAASLWKNGRFSEILFTGMGSSYFAPHTTACLLSSLGIRSSVRNAGELLHYHSNIISPDMLFTAISQSGESYEVVKILDSLPKGMTCIGVTNEEESTVARRASVTLLSRAGREDMTSSKTYISTLAVLHIYALSLAGKWSAKEADEIRKAADAVALLLKESVNWLDQVSDFLGHSPFVQVVGRGPSYSTVRQGALMFMEAARTPASGSYGGEFRHGPMEMVKEGFRAVVFAPEGNTFTQAIKLSEDITRFGGRALLITNSPVTISNSDIYKLYIPCNNEFLFPIPAIIPLQLIVNRRATADGNEPGNFTRGAKVTVSE
jgi:glutamine---fructose-6-phosphate transaminase (isomerizing)